MCRRTGVLLLFLLFIRVADAADTLRLCAYAKQYITTNPQTGLNSYDSWLIFPGISTGYRKVILQIRLQCPEKLMCGEWDYSDHFKIIHLGGKFAPEKSLEIGRVLTPYGRRFGPDWSFTWQLDLSDFADLLHDSVEFRYEHSGYEASNDRGWLLSACFNLVKGPPVMNLISLDTICQGNFPYGDSTRPIGNYLPEYTVNPAAKAFLGRCRILQTGHGMDEKEGCAEFCAKSRDILWDGRIAYHKLIWKECASNPLFPQAGTWIYDRANWCPGELNQPDLYDFSLDESVHKLKIVMQDYTAPKPTANYQVSAYFLKFAKPRFARDAGLEDILVPSALQVYSRLDQVLDSPRVIVKNLGYEGIHSLDFRYGFTKKMSKVFHWDGNLICQQQREIALSPLELPLERTSFFIELFAVDGKMDEYPADNVLTSVYNPPPVLARDLIVYLQTNREARQNGLKLIDGTRHILMEHPLGKLDTCRLYLDTLHLKNGLYELIVVDTAGDGLEFWANPEGGKGICRLLSPDGRLLKNFNPDFGNDFHFAFRVDDNIAANPDTAAVLEVFPIRNSGKFFVDVFFNERQNLVKFQLLKPDSSLAAEKNFIYVKEGRLNFDITDLPDAIYNLKIFSEQGVYFRRVKLVHKS